MRHVQLNHLIHTSGSQTVSGATIEVQKIFHAQDTF
jgi:hypothetical protein